jgi:dipeptidyl aminopeptidase/acylaminoacyl peptidase
MVAILMFFPSGLCLGPAARAGVVEASHGDGEPSAVRGPSPEPSPNDVASAVVGLQSQSIEGSLSPSGRWICYHERRDNPQRHGADVAWMLQLSAGGTPSTRYPIARCGAWRPDDKMLIPPSAAGNSFSLFDPADRSVTALPALHDGALTSRTELGRLTISNLPADGRWSASRRYFAFVARSLPTAPNRQLDSWRTSLVSEWHPTRRRSSFGLFIADLTTGEIRLASPLHLSVLNFDWSPNERALVLEVEDSDDVTPWGQVRTNLMILDWPAGTVRPLVSIRGSDEAEPRWSPDGNFIAFVQHTGESYRAPHMSRASPTLAIVTPSAGAIRRFPQEGQSNSWIRYSIEWNRNSRSFLYRVMRDMRLMIKRADVSGLETSILPFPPSSLAVPYISGVSFDLGQRRMLYSIENGVTPPSLYLTMLDRRQQPVGSAWPIASIASLPILNRLRVENVTWPSTDGRFNISGLLYLPAGCGGEADSRRRLPTMIVVRGGPNMVEAYFRGEFGVEVSLALHGYAVLVPNTRGREGYSEQLGYGIRDGRSRYALPFSDAIAGLDMLIARGISDRDRVGIFGQSYGGALAAYAITQTDRFRAAIEHEGATNNLLNSDIAGVDSTDVLGLLMMNWYGRVGFSNRDWHEAIAESPLLNADRARTPMLLMYGSQSGLAEREGLPFYNALRRFRVPSVMLIRNMGHGPSDEFEWPQTQDLIAGTIEWFDYWVRGIPYPDPRRAAQFDSWRSEMPDTASRYPRPTEQPEVLCTAS